MKVDWYDDVSITSAVDVTEKYEYFDLAFFEFRFVSKIFKFQYMNYSL